MWLPITNNVVFFFVSDLKTVSYKQLLILDHNVLDKRAKILCHYLFGDKIIQNYLKINATHSYYDLLQRQETQ